MTLSKFRTNHKLPVENGRWKNIARENRICLLCNNGEIGDEFHYLFKCQYFGNQRKIYIKKNIARENRICLLCNNGEIGDEFHYLFKCQYFGNQRKIYIKKNIRINPNIIKFKLLMTSTSKIMSFCQDY